MMVVFLKSDQRMAGKPSVGELEPFDMVEWKTLAPNRHPIDVAIGERMRVYYKIDGKKHFVRATTWNGLVKTITMSDGVTSSAGEPGDSWSDYDLRMLRIGQEELEDIRRTGCCKVSIFTNGGLKKFTSPSVVETTDAGGVATNAKDVRWEHVGFLSCFLVEIRKWSRPGHPKVAADPSVAFEQCAFEPQVTSADLYVARVDAERLRLRPASEWKCANYPFKIREGFPSLVFWLFQAACAIRDLPESKPADVLKWLESNAPNGEWEIRGIKSIAVLAHPGYKLRATFDSVSLGDFSPAEELLPCRLPKGLCLLMAITEWWLDQIERGAADRKALSFRLESASFGTCVIPNLVRLISKKGMTLEEGQDTVDEKALRRRELTKEIVEKSGSSDIALMKW